jgi:hypothetical protein
MQTHADQDRRDWLRSLEQKANRMQAAGHSVIAGGKEGEETLAEWESGGVGVVQRPPDEHGILRISIGGGETPVPLNYCVFRGEHGACVDLLRKALAALEAGPE